VAGQVCSLAHRSAGVERQTQEFIGQSVPWVEDGTSLVDGAGQTMPGIVLALGSVSDIVAKTSSAGVEHRRGVGQLNSEVAQMDQTARQDAATMAHSAPAPERLRGSAQPLVQAGTVLRIATGRIGLKALAGCGTGRCCGRR
jgi:methyl-accepting chemotaxis protein